MRAEKTKRNSNIELLRIIAMLAIIAGHFVIQSGMLKYTEDSTSILALNIIGSRSAIAVNIFLMIGSWFMVDREFKAKNVLKLYVEVLLYSVVITTIMVILGVDASKKDIFRGYMPFFGRALWFVSAYISLMILSPYLKKAFLLEKKKMFTLVVILFVLLSFVSTLPDRQGSYLCDSLWFIFVYLVVGFLKKYTNIQELGRRKWIFIVLSIGIYLLLTVGKVVFYNNEIIIRLLTQYIEDIKTIPNFICALCMFIFFINMKPRNNKIINYIAQSTLGVYIIHQVPAFIKYLWFNICKCESFYYSKYIVLYTIGIIIGVYVVASIIDRIRIVFIEPRLEKNKLFEKICKKIDDLYC